MDELMMNLFSLIADQVRSRRELFEEEGRIMQSLLNVGYRLSDADAAITLMQGLVQKQVDNFFGPDHADRASGVRVMNGEERRRFTPEAFAFAVKLSHLGVLSRNQREELMERAMALYGPRIELDHIKPLVAFMLFSGSSEHRESGSSHRIKNSTWH